MRTQDQKRAQDAYNVVGNLPDDARAKFKTLVLKFPAMVLQNGLLASLAFVQNKDNTQGKQVFNAYNNWLTGSADWLDWTGTGNGNVVARLCHPQMTVDRYRQVTREALAYGTWLKRAAEVELADVATQD